MPTLNELHHLARQGIKLYALNKDPLTAHAAELLMQATTSKLNAVQQNAALLLRRQVDAHRALFPYSLDDA